MQTARIKRVPNKINCSSVHYTQKEYKNNDRNMKALRIKALCWSLYCELRFVYSGCLPLEDRS